jgi:AcrR family transcriptional regulator
MLIIMSPRATITESLNTAAAPTQRTLQREETRRQLVQAGLRVVASVGFAGATTAAIALETNKAHGTVFVHFPTREAIVSELVAEVGRGMSRHLAALDSTKPTIADVMDAHLKALAASEVLYGRMLGEASTLPLAARAQIFALQAGVASRLREAYLRAPKRSVRPIDPLALTNIWISLTNHYVMNRDLFAPNNSVIKRCGAQIKQQVLTLVMR